MKQKRNIFKKYTIYLIVATLVYLTLANLYIYRESKQYLYNSTKLIPHAEYGLLLGTSKYFKKGEHNDFYANRVEAAVLLISQNKISKIIVSGTHELVNYSEPLSIKKDLMSKGVADSLIILDFDGDRTLLSIMNFKNEYKKDSLIIISQDFHNQRAVYLARKHGLNAWGFNAKEVKFSTSYKVLFRELFAKGKAIFE